MALDIVSYAMGKKKGGVQPTGEIEITQNGITNVSGYATANVDVEPTLQKKSLTINSNTTTKIEPDSNYDGLEEVNITTNIPQPSGKIEITENGTDIDISSYATADVSVSGGGGDISEYLSDTITPTSYAKYGWTNLIKKLLTPIKFTGTNLSYAFAYYTLDIEIPEIPDTSNVTTMQMMFYQCGNVLNLNNIENFNVSNCTDFRSMFAQCQEHYEETLDLSNWNIKNNYSTGDGIRMNTMFHQSDFQKIIFPIGQIAKANCQNMFGSCMAEEIDISDFNVTDSCVCSGMFGGCFGLQKIDISSLDFSKITNFSFMFGNPQSYSNVPYECLILVKDQTQVDWFTTNFPDYINVQIKS